MGTIYLQIPADLPAKAKEALSRGYFAGLPDYMPWPSHLELAGTELRAGKDIPESACLVLPWYLPASLDGIVLPGAATSPWMISTATLIERPASYRLPIELARGKINTLRNQAADWQAGGLNVTPAIAETLLKASLAFAEAVCRQDLPSGGQSALKALMQGLASADQLVNAYVDQVFSARLSRTPKLATRFACALTGPPPSPEGTERFKAAFNTVRLPFDWRECEVEPAKYQWDDFAARLEWAKDNNLAIEAGPVIDLSPESLPPWLSEYFGDSQTLNNYMLDFLEAALNRFGSEIKPWQVMSAANFSHLLQVDEEEMIWLVSQLLSTAQQVHPDGEHTLSLAQPWGDGLGTTGRHYAPFVFMDALLRSRVSLAALELELVNGPPARASYVRDRLDTSRMLDLYALLGLPVQVAMGHPSSAADDPLAEPIYGLSNDSPHPYHPEEQARWAERFVPLCVCKPYVVAVTWSHWSDAAPHRLPHCGVLDAAAKPKPVLASLTSLREQRIR